MPMQRHIERHQLPYYLKVYNRITDKPMGYIGNVSYDGLLLVSELPMLIAGRFDMRIKLPGQITQCFIDFTATCKWSREDVTPGYFDSGFSLIAPPVEYTEMVEALRVYFSFHPLSASA
ncbi:pilus assembly protein PilZ [Pseudomonas sp. M30-35]|uniref:pilus assembly protein PilZ n=1 Tax=Pseudomonas sp. M30-35 TaxID=1981174 RepID=UPI000B3CABCC|nr:pilus assembly protein PilZ [Pseudomonas sp. M30-35]ARU89615.1 pilus assembly protein PilZ [Pseudomonas sp. M30-35]